MNNPHTKAMLALAAFVTLAGLSAVIPAIATALTVLAITVFCVGGLVAIGVLIEFNLPRRIGDKPQPPDRRPAP